MRDESVNKQMFVFNKMLQYGKNAGKKCKVIQNDMLIYLYIKEGKNFHMIREKS